MNATRRAELSSPAKNRLIGAIQATHNVAEACRQQGIKYHTGLDIWHKYKVTGKTSNRRRSGRPSKVTRTAHRALIREIKKNRRKPFREIGNELPTPISESTVRRVASQHGLHRRVARKVPFLTWIQKKKRRLFAERFWDWGEEEWRNVAWSDEVYLCLGSKKDRVWVTRAQDEEWEDECCIGTFSQSDVRVMMWGIIAKDAKGPLVVLEYPGGPGGGMTAARYCEQVLKGPMLTFFKSLQRERPSLHFQQDGASPHRSPLTQKWLLDHHIPIFPHPPSSPDVNPIENVWRDLKRAVRALPRQPTTRKQLADAAKQAWDNIPIDKINRYIDRMPAIMADLVEARGGHTKY
jgi:hypothetical protein